MLPAKQSCNTAFRNDRKLVRMRQLSGFLFGRYMEKIRCMAGGKTVHFWGVSPSAASRGRRTFPRRTGQFEKLVAIS